MKKQYTQLNLLLFIIISISCLFFISSCDSSNEGKKKEFKGSYHIPALLERKKDLSYDEFLKIKEKYNKLSAEYNADHTSYKSLIKLAEIYIFEARVTGEHPYYYNAALETLNQLIKSKDKITKDQYFTALFYKSTVQLSQHQFNDALVSGKIAVKLNPVNSGIYGVLVDANVEIGNYADAVKSCDKMMSIRPDLRSYSRVSYLREIYGDFKGSKESMNLAIEAGAPYSEYKCWTIVTMARMLESHNELDSAYAYYKFATEERKDYPFGIGGMASVEAKRGHYVKADSLYKVALKAIPEIRFKLEQAEMYKKEGKIKEYKAEIPEIEKMFQEDLESGHNVNMEYANFLNEYKNDYDQALELGLKEVKKRPNNIDVNKLLAYTYYAKGDMANASKHIKIAMRTNKQDADLYCIAGLINHDKSLIKKSFSIDPYQNHLFVKEAKKMIS